MSQTDRIFRATRSEHYQTQAQRSRMRGPILGMEYPRKPLFQRMREWVRR